MVSRLGHFFTLLLAVTPFFVVTQQAMAFDYDAYDEDVAALLWEYQNEGDAAEAPHASIKPSVLVFNDIAYSDTIVDFDTGLVIITATTVQRLQESIVEVVLTQIDPAVIDAKTARDFGLVNEKTNRPFFWKQILDHRGKPIEQPLSATLFAEHLTRNVRKKNGRFKIKIKMAEKHKDIAGDKYIQYARAASQQHDVPISLMMAIMETESSFNPLARSGSNALGLMQIKANTAGRDYFSIIKGYKHTPSSSYLYKPSNNIEVAAGYLRILGTRYLSGIRHPKKLEYAMISSYNGGAGNLWRSLDKNANKTKSLARINKMSVSEFYWFLTNRHIRGETRNYLKKVVSKQKKYIGL
jgi:membrane-bound lytic murein transglycosylase C